MVIRTGAVFRHAYSAACVPGRELAVNHDRHHDAYVAVRDAFDAAHRQLEVRAERLRGDIKHHERRATK